MATDRAVDRCGHSAWRRDRSLLIWRRENRLFRLHEDALLAGVNLLVLIFMAAFLVLVVAFGDDGGPSAHVDALYFTVSTLTTMGFGDIALTMPGGKLLSVCIMVLGVGSFLRLARASFSPRVRLTCLEGRSEPARARRDPIRALRRAAEDRNGRQRNPTGQARRDLGA